ncbi:APC family permease [Blastococcus sp. SYSU D00695]
MENVQRAVELEPDEQSVAEELGLEPGHLTAPQLVSLAVASFVPAVGMSFAPLLFFQSAGAQAWTSALLAMIITISVGLSVIVFARRFVVTGSLFSYISEVFGPWARHITAAALLLGFVMQLGAMGNLVGIYVGSVLIESGVDNALDLEVQAVVMAVAMGVVGIIASRGLDTSWRVIVVSALVTVPVMLYVSIGSAVETGLHLSEQFDLTGFSPDAVFQGMAGGVSFLVAFESCSALASETSAPKRTVPLAIMSVPVVIGLIYLVTTVLQVPGLASSMSELAEGASPVAALAGVAGLPEWAGSIGDLLIGLTVFASLLGFVNFGSRYLVTLGELSLLPRPITSVHRRRNTPVVAIVALLVLAYSFMVGMIYYSGDLTSAYTALVSAVVICWAPMYMLVTVGAVVLMVRNRELRIVPLVGSVVGFSGMAFLYVNGWISPPATPADQMSWLIPIAIAVIAVSFALAARRRARSEV